jgi:hypothetical protein
MKREKPSSCVIPSRLLGFTGSVTYSTGPVSEAARDEWTTTLENGVPGLEGFDQAVVSRDLGVPGLDCRQMPRGKISPGGATETSRAIQKLS